MRVDVVCLVFLVFVFVSCFGGVWSLSDTA